MADGYLVYKPGTSSERRIRIRSRLLVGRTGDCDLPVDDPAASRHHLEIVRKGDSFIWRDLNSTNGTLYNGKPARGGELRDGDCLQIGETILLFETHPCSDSPNEEENIVEKTVLDFDARPKLPPDQSKACDLLKAVYTVTNEIATNYEPCRLVDEILSTTIKAVEAQRGAVFFGDTEKAELLPCPVCGHVHMIKDGKLSYADSGEIKISRSVAVHVLKDGESVLYCDSGAAGDSTPSESIQALNLRSIICVPLRGKFGILGVLYIDTDRPERRYTNEDLLLCTAVGNSAGLALENATLHQQMLEKQRIEQEIEFAWTIQQGFLTRKWPESQEKSEVYGETWPAKVVGGDFYDYVALDENRVGILIGDVSGKGVPAALTMAQLLAEFRLRVHEKSSPDEVVAALNENLVERSRRGMFCTILWLVLDLHNGRVIWANAGHLPPLVIGKKDAEFLDGAEGPPIGIVPQLKWKNQQAAVEPGDTILLVTDGVIEARRSETTPKEEFGMERLRLAARKYYGSPPRELIEGISREVLAFCAPDLPHDDITMIAVRYKP